MGQKGMEVMNEFNKQ